MAARHLDIWSAQCAIPVAYHGRCLGNQSPSPGIAVPNSAMVLAPVQASSPPTSQTIRAAPGDGTFVSIDPGEVKTPLPMTMLTIMANASKVPRFRLNVPCTRWPDPASCGSCRFCPASSWVDASSLASKGLVTPSSSEFRGDVMLRSTLSDRCVHFKNTHRKSMDELEIEL